MKKVSIFKPDKMYFYNQPFITPCGLYDYLKFQVTLKKQLFIFYLTNQYVVYLHLVYVTLLFFSIV